MKVSTNQVLSISYNICEIVLCAPRDFGPRHFRRTTHPLSIEVHIHYFIRDTTLVLGPGVLDFDSVWLARRSPPPSINLKIEWECNTWKETGHGRTFYNIIKEGLDALRTGCNKLRSAKVELILSSNLWCQVLTKVQKSWCDMKK